METQSSKESGLERITFRKIADDAMRVLNLEKGLLHTVWELTRRPGSLIRRFLFEDRSRMTRPVGFLVFFVTISSFFVITFADAIFRIDEADDAFRLGLEGGGKIAAERERATMTVVMDSLSADSAAVDRILGDSTHQEVDSMALVKQQQKEQDKLKAEQAIQKMGADYLKYYNVSNFFSVPVLAFFSFLFFRNKKYYFSEHLVVSAYITGYMAFLFLLSIPCFFLNSELTGAVMMLVSFVYVIYALSSTFPYESTLESIFRSVGCYFAYFIVYMMLTLVVYGAVFVYYWKYQ
ncbi:MAG: DUF3667 domain-containing protein [Bacteroidota bacterium]